MRLCRICCAFVVRAICMSYPLYLSHRSGEGRREQGIEIMARKFYIGSYAGSHTVYEIVQRGERAVSPRFFTRQEAEAAITVLRSHQMIDAAA